MKRPISVKFIGILLTTLLFLLGACNRRPTDIFPPVIIGEATAAPTILNTPALTPTAVTQPTNLPATRIITPTSLAPTSLTVTPSPLTPSSRTPNGLTIVIRTPSGRQGTPVAVNGTPRTVTITTPINAVTPAAAVTPTAIFRNYLALIVSQLGPIPTPTATAVSAQTPAPLVLTNTPVATDTPTQIPTVMPTATNGTPTGTPTPFTGQVRLLDRDPVNVDGIIPVVYYADVENILAKTWSNFYAQYPLNSSLARLYASESSRVYGPALALTAPEQWAEGVCMVSSTLVGVQFWGDDNDGWARVLVDGVERWSGNTYGQSPIPFVRFLEISNLSPAPHVIRIEPLGRRGSNLPGSDDHVSIYAIVCGIPVKTEIFVPLLLR